MRLRLAFAPLLFLLVAGCASGPSLLREALPAGSPALELRDVPFFPQQDYQCGPAALAMLLAQRGLQVTPEALVAQVYLPGRHGSLQPELIATVRRHEQLPYPVTGRLAAVLAQLQAGHPVLVLQNLGLRTVPVWHYAVVIGYSVERDEILLHSGVSARLAMPARAFERSWERAGRWGLLALPPGELPADADPQVHVEAAAGLEATRHYAAASTAYAAALARWPRNGLARLGLANSQYALGETGRAERLYRELVAQEPANVVARNNLASVLAERGCIDEARAQLAQALAQPQLTPALRALLAQTGNEIERYPQSSSACSSASISP